MHVFTSAPSSPASNHHKPLNLLLLARTDSIVIQFAYTQIHTKAHTTHAHATLTIYTHAHTQHLHTHAHTHTHTHTHNTHTHAHTQPCVSCACAMQQRLPRE